jgi:hypothetical protein
MPLSTQHRVRVLKSSSALEEKGPRRVQVRHSSWIGICNLHNRHHNTEQTF